MLFLVKIAVALGLFVGLVWYLEPGQLYIVALQLEGWIALCVVLLALLGLGIQVQKWHLLLPFCSSDTTRLDALRSLLAGMGLGLFTPGRVGELGRGIALRGENKQIALFVAIDRLFSMGITLLLGLGAWAWMGSGNWLWSLVIILSLGCGARWILRRLWHYGTMRYWGAAADGHLRRVDRATWLKLAVWSTLFNFVFFAQFFMLVGAFYGWSQQVAAMVPMLFAAKSILPVGFLDIGVREGVAVGLYAKMGYDPLPAFNASLLIFVLNVAIPGLIGWSIVGRRVNRWHALSRRGMRKVIP
jgi:hypothetical protein